MATLNKYRKNYISNMLNALHRRWIVLRLSTGRLAGIGKTSQAVHNLLGFLAVLLSAVLGETCGLWFARTRLSIPEASARSMGILFRLLLAVMALRFLQIPFSALITSQERMPFYSKFSIVEAAASVAWCTSCTAGGISRTSKSPCP